MATDMHPMDFDVLSDTLYEVIDGRIVELPLMATSQEVTAGILTIKLGSYVSDQGSGLAVVETLFDFTEQIGKKRRPDVAFIANSRWPQSEPVSEDDGWKVVPNLAVEIVSSSNTWEGMYEKIREYFRVGVQRVWVVSTVQRTVHVYDSPTRIRVLSIDEVLTDDELLPGFGLPLTELFKRVRASDS